MQELVLNYWIRGQGYFNFRVYGLTLINHTKQKQRIFLIMESKKTEKKYIY